MTTHGYLVRTDGNEMETVVVEPDPERGTHLTSLYELLSVRLVDVIRLPEDIDLWVDDEGLINGSEPNPLLTNMLIAFGYDMDTHQIRGNGAFFAVDSEGSMTSLSDRQREVLQSVYRQAINM